MAFWRTFKSQVSWTKLAFGEIKHRCFPSSPGAFNKVPMNPFERFKKIINVNNKEYTFFDLPKFGIEYNQLPFSISVLLESGVRNCNNFHVTENNMQNILKWKTNQTIKGVVEVAFKPARVILQDFTGVPAVVDFAAMRDAVKSLGGDPDQINRVCPSDLVIDHSIQAGFVRKADAQQKNENLKFKRNKERFTFSKWGAKAFKNVLIVPPGSSIVHQVNLEYLTHVVFTDRNILYPDSLVSTDSRTAMINGLGVLGWGVGDMEAEIVMLRQAISMLLPQVLGYQLTETLNQFATSTDLILTITKHLRQIGVDGKFVEFFGLGVTQLSIADRAIISNMCPEYILSYLQHTNRSSEKIAATKPYLEAYKMLRNYVDPAFSQITTLVLGEVVLSISGPKIPHNRVSVSAAQKYFKSYLTNKLFDFDVIKLITTVPPTHLVAIKRPLLKQDTVYTRRLSKFITTFGSNEEVNLHECLELITRLSRRAGKIIKSRMNEKKKIETKASSIDFVTETDQEVEKLLIEGIKQKYPHHKFIGEESFAAGVKEELTFAPTWVIDPVDGTTNFMHNYPNVCISIALVVGFDIKFGVIYNPIFDMFFRAIKGEGSFLNDEPIKVSGVKQLTDALVAVEFGSVRSEEFRNIVNHNINYLATNAHGIRSGGSAAWNLAQIARGGIDLYVEMGIHAWDVAAGYIIVREAGGTVIDPAGNDFKLMNRRILATSSTEIAKEVCLKFQQYYPEHD